MGEDAVEHASRDEDSRVDSFTELSADRQSRGSDDAGRGQPGQSSFANGSFDFEAPLAVEFSGREVRGTACGPKRVGHLSEFEEELRGGDSTADDEGAQSAEVFDVTEIHGVQLVAFELGDAGDEWNVGLGPGAGCVDEVVAGERHFFTVDGGGDAEPSLSWLFGADGVHVGRADDAEFEFAFEAGVIVGDDLRGGYVRIWTAEREPR